MLQSKQGKVLVVVLATILVVAASVAVLSQQNPPNYPNQGGQGQPGMGPQGQYPGQGPMGPGQMGPGQMGPGQMGPNGPGGPGGMGMGMMGRMGGSVAIAATAEYVYVVQGTTLYQFSAKTLKQENKTELSTATRSQTPPQ